VAVSINDSILNCLLTSDVSIYKNDLKFDFNYFHVTKFDFDSNLDFFNSRMCCYLTWLFSLNQFIKTNFCQLTVNSVSCSSRKVNKTVVQRILVITKRMKKIDEVTKFRKLKLNQIAVTFDSISIIELPIILASALLTAILYFDLVGFISLQFKLVLCNSVLQYFIQ
jgi:hypothetical protein